MSAKSSALVLGLRRHFDDDVELGRLVVDDRESDSVVVQPGRDVHVGIRRLEKPRRMVVDEHLAARRKPGQREHAHRVAARHHPRRLNDALGVYGAGEADFAAAGEPDRGSNRPRGR